MPDSAAAIKILKERYPEATVGLDNGRPYARLPNGTLYGVIFMGEELLAIVNYPSGHLSSRNLIVVERLDGED